ncbi:phospholipase A2 inhibitor and Ly6/PLAUR domain-containing protein-like [Dendropsophus ebraccatus]|uniref:phospholipase A2 inhibitor and Ly6/PLAUR domain-containing protein-like n=1 Tax=Dendropsophus ebraccatus TaxID=150705 RepID=UPI0038315CEB
MIRSFILSLTILCAVSWTGLALQCLECLEANGETCEGVSVQCPNSTECMVVSQLFRIRDTVYHSIKKGCNPWILCNKPLYVSNFNTKEKRIYVQCCTEDDCNTDGYQMPPLKTEHSGVECPTCFEKGLKECTSENTVKCVYEEDKCFNYIGKFIDPGNQVEEESFKGCISPMGCILKFDALIGVQEIKTDTFECS